MKAVLGLTVCACLVFFDGPAWAQEGCRTTANSCTQIYQGCEARCQKSSNNASACIAKVCTTPLTECKGTGVWRSRATSSACWKTNKLS